MPYTLCKCLFKKKKMQGRERERKKRNPPPVVKTINRPGNKVIAIIQFPEEKSNICHVKERNENCAESSGTSKTRVAKSLKCHPLRAQARGWLFTGSTMKMKRSACVYRCGRKSKRKQPSEWSPCVLVSWRWRKRCRRRH